MIDWTSAADQLDAAVAGVFDMISCRTKPMRSPGMQVNAKPIADSGRAEFDFVCSMDLGPSQDAIPRHLPSDTGVRGTMVSYDAVLTALTGDWPWVPGKGDRFEVLITSGMFASGSQWSIIAGEEDGSSRRAFYLNRLA
jgi:hypothetical protein